MPRNTHPSAIVMNRNINSARRWPVCAACTASAIVKLLVMSTAVFTVPAQTISSRLPAVKAAGYQLR